MLWESPLRWYLCHHQQNISDMRKTGKDKGGFLEPARQDWLYNLQSLGQNENAESLIQKWRILRWRIIKNDSRASKQTEDPSECEVCAAPQAFLAGTAVPASNQPPHSLHGDWGRLLSLAPGTLSFFLASLYIQQSTLQTQLETSTSSNSSGCLCYSRISQALPCLFLDFFSPLDYVANFYASCKTQVKCCLLYECLWGPPWWLRDRESACQCRRHGLEPWSGKIPHASEQLSHNFWACALELGNWNYWGTHPRTPN